MFNFVALNFIGFETNVFKKLIFLKFTKFVFLFFRNIVCTVNLDCKLDLKKIALHARNAEYNPKRFAAVIMRIREPRTTALIFSSGKMVCTGAKRYIYIFFCSFFVVFVLYRNL